MINFNKSRCLEGVSSTNTLEIFFINKWRQRLNFVIEVDGSLRKQGSTFLAGMTNIMQLLLMFLGRFLYL